MLMMTIGPSRVAPSVLERMSAPPMAITDPAFLEIFRQCLVDLQTILGAKDGQGFIIPGTGTMGMEMAAASFLPPGSKVAVISTGFWGDRWAMICKNLGIDVCLIQPPAGLSLDVDEIKAVLKREKCQALLVTHVDSSTGFLVDLEALAPVVKELDILFLVDGMCSAAIESVEQTLWGIDAYVTSTPKGIGVPAGLILISLSGRAVNLLKDRAWQCPGFSLDMKPWLPVMEAAQQGAFGYFQSPAGNLVLGLAEGLRLIVDEGVANRVSRHAAITQKLHSELQDLGIEILTGAAKDRAHGATVCFYPGDPEQDFLEKVKGFGVLLVKGLHTEVAAKTFRIGHLGNVTFADIDQTVDALKKAMTAGYAQKSTTAG